MPRPQFTLRSLLVAMLVVAAFFGGMVVGQRCERSRFLREIEQPAVGYPTPEDWEKLLRRHQKR